MTRKFAFLLSLATHALAQTPLVTGIGNFIHDVADLDRSVVFYRDVLGLDMPRPAGDWQTTEGVLKMYDAVGARFRVANAQVAGSPMRVELAEFQGVERKPVRRQWGVAGNSVLMLTMPDLAAVEARIKSANVPVLVKEKKACDGRGIVVSDPDGFAVMLVERAGPPSLKFGYVTDGDAMVKGPMAALGLQVETRTYSCRPVEQDLLGGDDPSVVTLPSGFEVWLAAGKNADRHDLPRPRDPGAAVLRFAVSNTDAAVAALKGAGVTVVSAGGEVQTLAPAGLRAAILRAPDDLLIQVVK